MSRLYTNDRRDRRMFFHGMGTCEKLCHSMDNGLKLWTWDIWPSLGGESGESFMVTRLGFHED